ncbi:MAG: ABC transporter permease [Lautropia sp.]|nr:ABC transporter permease [Lautropia sp.]
MGGRGFWQRALRHPGFVTGAVLSSSLLLMALLSLLWTPYSPLDVDMGATLAPPSAAHWLGTDAYGRDVLSLLLLGAQSSILAGVIAVGIGLVGGVVLGLLAAARPGWLQELILRTADLMLAFPAILTAIMLTAVFGAGLGNAIVAVGVYNIPSFIRLTRAAAATVWSREYTLAARAIGMSRRQITWRHVLPNILPVLLVQISMRFAIAILAEAALSYLGFGVQPPQPSWGRMLADAQAMMFEAPLLAVWPGMAIMLAVLGLNLLGDGLRDLIDPKLARRR